jgi:hypothetical protein
MKYKVVKFSYIDFQKYLWKGLWVQTRLNLG